MKEPVEVAEADVFVKQEMNNYSPEDHEVWSALYEKRMSVLESTACSVYLKGAREIGLRSDSVPDLREVNEVLSARTGWAAVPVRGFIPAADFFQFLSRRRFPTTIIVRPRRQMDYLPEPDIFHDVFGHVPLHSDPVFADFLQRFGTLAAAARTAEDTERMARLFWFTVEFGLIRENGAIKVYGSGLISSAGDAANALSDRCDKRPFVLEQVLAQPFEIDHFQDVLFHIDSFEELFRAVETIENH